MLPHLLLLWLMASKNQIVSITVIPPGVTFIITIFYCIGTLEWLPWPPKYPAIQFPSKAFERGEGTERGDPDSSSRQPDGLEDDYKILEDDGYDRSDAPHDAATDATAQRQHQHTEL